MAAVSLRKLTKRYGSKEVVHAVDLDIAHNEFLVLVGPSGCGKSTILRMVAGLEEVSAGDILIDGRRVNELDAKDRDTAMVFQDYALYPHMSVYENVAFSLRYRGFRKDEIRERVMRTAQTLGIQDLLERRPRQLSGGQRQRVAMGRCMVRDPKVFLFDEPLSNLDAKLRVTMRGEIKRLHQRAQTTVIYVTHDQVEAMTLADRIVIMNQGRIEQVGRPEQIYARPKSRFVAGFIGSPAMNFLPARLCMEGSRRIARVGENFHVTLTDPLAERCADFISKEVTLGIRHEAFSWCDRPEDAALVAVATDVEPLGSETHVYFELMGETLVCRMPNGKVTRAGAMLQLSVDMAGVHLFDPVTEQAI